MGLGLTRSGVGAVDVMVSEERGEFDGTKLEVNGAREGENVARGLLGTVLGTSKLSQPGQSLHSRKVLHFTNQSSEFVTHHKAQTFKEGIALDVPEGTFDNARFALGVSLERILGLLVRDGT